ncbi:MAG: anthranilate synthase component I [Acidimicrobiales bacterium]
MTGPQQSEAEHRSAFFELAKGRAIVPVWRELMADTLTPVGAFQHVVSDDEPGFLLESIEGGDRWGRYSFIGRRPLMSIVSTGSRAQISGEIQAPESVTVALPHGVLATLEALLESFGAPLVEGLPPLHSGLVGYLGYDVVREVEHLTEIPPDTLGLPDASMFLIGQLCVFDHWRQRVVLIQNVPVSDLTTEPELDAAYGKAQRRLDELASDLFRPMTQIGLPVPTRTREWPEVTRTLQPDDYERAVLVAKEYIRAGDVFQVVLSQRFDLELSCDPFDVYRVLRQVNPSPYLYFVRSEACTVVGSSPEPMVRLRDGTVTSRPVAGTRPRGRTEEEDRRLGAELAEHPKETAEHIMLVDLARNDVGRVVKFGTERVEELMTLERYSTVMHLTSQVSGELAIGKGPIDVLRATIPAGTLSGAPKVRAMQIIDELEPTKRGVYGGVVGYLDLSGNLDTAIAIRTMIVTPDGRASVQAGAGIVADSDPHDEQVECENKASTILSAVRAAREMTGSRNASRAD